MFVVVDPLGTAAVFSALTRGMDGALQRKTALKAVVIAFFILFVFSLIGESLLHYMQISLPAFRVAGGALLFVTAFRMIMGFHDPDQMASESNSHKSRSDIAVFPLAIPLLAGPGCMTAIIMFSTAAGNAVEYMQVMLATGLVSIIALFSLCSAGAMGRLLGPTGYGIITRVMGILLAAMAVQFVADGVTELFDFRAAPGVIPEVMNG